MSIVVRTQDAPEITALLKNRRDAGVTSDGGDVTITCNSAEARVKAAWLLADVIIEHLQITFIHKQIDAFNPAISKRLKREIAYKALRSLYDRNPAEVDRVKADVCQRLLTCIEQGLGSALDLNGFMRFRMKDYTKAWERAVGGVISDMIDESVYNEYIEVLSSYLRCVGHAVSVVHVYAGPQGYAVTDENGETIELTEFEAPDWFFYDMTGADLLLSTLLMLSPERIYVHGAQRVERRGLLYSINRIFDGRVVFV